MVECQWHSRHQRRVSVFPDSAISTSHVRARSFDPALLIHLQRVAVRCVVLSCKSSERSGASPDRWIAIAFQAGLRDEFSGDVRLTRRCLASFSYFSFCARVAHRQTGQHQLITCGKKTRKRENEGRGREEIATYSAETPPAQKAAASCQLSCRHVFQMSR